MPDETPNVPQWFTNFAVKNAEEHGLLAARIEASHGDLAAKIAASNARIDAAVGRLEAEIARAETRSTRWTIAALAVGFTVMSALIILVD